jgi:hypothetical protein
MPLKSKSKATKPKPKSRATTPVPGDTMSQHHCLTVGRTYKSAAMGMRPSAKVTNAGNTAHFQVSYLTKLGQQGAGLAQAILQNCERDYTTLQQAFGSLTPHRLPFVVQITADNSGASHSSCLGTDISIGGKSGPSVDFIRSLLVAEADEVFNPRPNFVDQTAPTDTDYNSIGCSVLFLNWLRFQLNHTWADIIAAGSGTLAATYKNLTGKATAWTDFQTVINAHFPVGKKYTLGTDNPFPL